MKYAFFMFGIPMLIFITAFIETRKKLAVFHTLMFIFIILLACVLAFYYKDKLHVLKQLKQVKDLVEYEKGGIVEGIEAKGNGSLQELGAGVQV